MAVPANALKSPWVAALAVLLLIWTIWSLDLHPHYAPKLPEIQDAYTPELNTPGQADSIVIPDHGQISAPAPTSQAKSTSTTSPSVVSTSLSEPSVSTAIDHTNASDRPLILYAFFDTELARLNIQFFIDHALHGAADFIFVFNGETDAENLLPHRPNVKYVKRSNDCYDLGAFAEVLLKDDLYKKYKRFITLNASVRGPFFPAWSKGCWSDVYLSKVTEKVKLVGMTLSCQPLNHIQSMIWATDRIGIETLLFPSDELIKKFDSELPEYNTEYPVPKWETAGINSCPHEYWKAVAIEVYATPLIRSAGFEVEPMMMAYYSSAKYEEECKEWLDGDILSHEHYYGMDIHPFDTIFAKTNRGNDPLTLGRLTEWTSGMNYTSYDHCH